MVLNDSFPCMILHRRNLACRGCGCPRSESQVAPLNCQALGMSSARLPTSPRFANGAGGPTFYSSSSIPNPSHYSAMPHGARYPLAAQPVAGPKPASPSHPLLTPSGRDFSRGGKVQNISSDSSAPCIMYWPDNEPFPDQGQIRPSNISGIPVSWAENLMMVRQLIHTLATPHLEYRKSWTNRTSTRRLDLPEVQLFELETAQGLPDLLPMCASSLPMLP